MTININYIPTLNHIAVYDGITDYTSCNDCGLLNIPCNDFGAADYCIDCEVK